MIIYFVVITVLIILAMIYVAHLQSTEKISSEKYSLAYGITYTFLILVLIFTWSIFLIIKFLIIYVF